MAKPRFRRVCPRIWQDEKFCTLSHVEKLIALHILTAQSNNIGLFLEQREQVILDLLISESEYRLGLSTVLNKLGWSLFRGLFYIPNWFKYNAPDNINIFKFYLQDLDRLPNNPLMDKFFENVTWIPEHMLEPMAKRYEERYGKPTGYGFPYLRKLIGIRDEGLGIRDRNKPPAAAPVVGGTNNSKPEFQNPNPITEAEFCVAWNQLGPPFRNLLRWTEQRQAALAAANANSVFAARWREALDVMGRSNFCRGGGDKGFVATADWFLKDGTVEKLLEGTYSNREGASDGEIVIVDAPKATSREFVRQRTREDYEQEWDDARREDVERDAAE